MMNYGFGTPLTNYRPTIFFVCCLVAIAIFITLASQAFGFGLVSTSFTKTLGKTLCLCLIAISMDVVWGYCGILSLGHFAFFGLGGYMIGMWLMYARTKDIVLASIVNQALPATAQELREAIGTQIFGVVGGAKIPWVWYFADSLTAQLVLVVLVPGLLALVFGWLAFRSRVTGVYLSILTQAMTLALSLYLFQNDSGLRGNNGLSGLQNIPGLDHVSQDVVSIWFFWASTLALIAGYVFFAWLIHGKFGNIIRAIRDDEPRVRFTGYDPTVFKVLVFAVSMVAP